MGTGGTSVAQQREQRVWSLHIKGNMVTRSYEPQMYRNEGGTAGDVAEGKRALGKGLLYSGQF